MVYVLANTGGVKGFREYVGFLFRMFSDRNILPLPSGVRQSAASAIALLRAPFVYKKYRLIGGSPLVDQMRVQAHLLEGIVKEKVYVGCLYTRPFLSDLLKGLDDLDVSVIPMYPHYSVTTTGSVVDVVKGCRGWRRVRLLRGYGDHPLFVEAWAEAIEEIYGGEYLLFVAHGVPVNVAVRDGYYREVLRSCRLIAEAVGVEEYRVAFQSRIGPVEWVKPYVEDVLADLAAHGVDGVLVVPVSFLNEHLETLYDVDIEMRGLAEELGIGHFKRVRVPWSSEKILRCWLEALKEDERCMML